MKTGNVLHNSAASPIERKKRKRVSYVASRVNDPTTRGAARHAHARSMILIRAWVCVARCLNSSRVHPLSSQRDWRSARLSGFAVIISACFARRLAIAVIALWAKLFLCPSAFRVRRLRCGWRVRRQDKSVHWRRMFPSNSNESAYVLPNRSTMIERWLSKCMNINFMMFMLWGGAKNDEFANWRDSRCL